MITLVIDRNGEQVADIYRCEKGTIRYNKYEPWVLRYSGGRYERHPLKSDAVTEARKSWPACTFRKG